MVCSFLSYLIIDFNVVPEWRIMVHLTINLLPYFLLVVATHLFSLCSNCFLSSHFTIDCNVHTIRSETTPIHKTTNKFSLPHSTQRVGTEICSFSMFRFQKWTESRVFV